MAAFAGYMMPLNYANGALREHLACREGAAVFDVSHMAQLDIVHPSGSAAPILAALERLVPANLIDLPEHQQRYGLLLNEHGGIIDDLMVIHAGDYVRLVVNAGCAEKDLTWLLARLPALGITRRQRALIAVQGPMAAEALGRLVQLPKNMRFMQVAVSQFSGHQIELSRSGYTGEDGFEVSLPEEVAEDFATALCKHEAVQMAGLVARDSLRLEAGLCLYGQDMDEAVSAVAASLSWAIPKIRRRGGVRAGGPPEDGRAADLRDAAGARGLLPARRRGAGVRLCAAPRRGPCGGGGRGRCARRGSFCGHDARERRRYGAAAFLRRRAAGARRRALLRRAGRSVRGLGMPCGG